MADTHKGEASWGRYEAHNAVGGRAPTTMWIAAGSESGEYDVIALVGQAASVMAFARRLARAKIPGYAGIVRENGEELAVILAGGWPSTRAREVALDLACAPGSTPREWLRSYKRHLQDPDRIELGEPEEGVTRLLVRMYSEECRRVCAS